MWIIFLFIEFCFCFVFRKKCVNAKKRQTGRPRAKMDGMNRLSGTWEASCLRLSRDKTASYILGLFSILCAFYYVTTQLYLILIKMRYDASVICNFYRFLHLKLKIEFWTCTFWKAKPQHYIFQEIICQHFRIIFLVGYCG